MRHGALDTRSQPPPLPAFNASATGPSAYPVGGFLLDFLIAIAALLALSLLCGLLWAVFSGLQLALTSGAAIEPGALLQALGEPDAIALIWMSLISTGGAALLVYWWRHRATRTEWAASSLAIRRPATWGWILLAASATFLFGAAITALSQRFGVAAEPTNAALIEAAFDQRPLFLLVFAVLLAPAYEELLFRRVLFGRLWAAGWPWLGLVLSSAAFALLHELPGLGSNTWQATLVLWLTYGLMGAVFAGVYWRTRTLWAAYVAHALNNAAALALMMLSAGG